MVKKGKSEGKENNPENMNDNQQEVNNEVDEKLNENELEEEKPDTSTVDELKTKLNEAEEKNKELQDKYLRLSAEFDNYRKRTLREKIELTKMAGESLILNLLPVVDDLERGLKTISDAKEIEPVKDGIYLIYNKFKEFLSQNGVKEIETENNEFNLDFHEAITKIPAPSEELKGKIVDVVKKGYTLNDKVIRFSKVVVGE